MATWGQRRKLFIEIGIGVLVLALLGSGWYFFFHKAPSCVDGKLNHGEEQIDCGGPCPNACSIDESPLAVNFVRALTPQNGRTDVIAYVTNPNTNAGAQNAQAKIQLFDSYNAPLEERAVNFSVPPAKTVPVFISNFYMGERMPGQVFMTIGTSTLTWPRTPTKVIVPTPKNVSIENSQTPRITATLANPTAKEIDNMTVVITVFDASGNAIAASQTVIKSLPGFGTTNVVFTWNTPFSAPPVRSEILPASTE